MNGETHKLSAVALQNRHLVKISKRGGWNASITDDGLYYLEHEAHPKDASSGARLTAGHPPALSHARSKRTRQGSAEPERDEDRAAAEPKARPERQGTPATDSVTVPAELRNPIPAVATLRDDRKRFAVSGSARQRALRIAQGLASAAEGRGWRVTLPEVAQNRWGKPWTDPDHFVVNTGEYVVGVRIEQEEDRSKHVLTASEERALKRNPWTHIPDWDRTPSERLRIRLNPTWGPTPNDVGARYTWSDGQRGWLARKLPGILEEINRRSQRERLEREERERKEAERARQWQTEVERAKALLRECHRAEVLLQQTADWRTAREIREFVLAMKDVLGSEDQQQEESAREWIAWAEQYVDGLDPLSHPITAPDDPEPTEEALRPFLPRRTRPGGGWSQ